MAPLEPKDVQIAAIQPFEKTDHVAVIEPSLLDLSFLDVYIPMIFFYKSKSRRQGAAGDLVAKMKDALSKVLVPFFPFAGRWVRTYDARIRELQCTDEGVPFIEASVDQELDSVLKNGSFETHVELNGYERLGLDPFAFNQDVDFPLPPVFVQATKFSCGGVALNVSIAHMTADGQGMSQFLTAWSEFALDGETSIEPIHDRSGILPRDSFMEFFGSEIGFEDELELQLETLELNGGAEDMCKTDPGAIYRLPMLSTLESKIFHVKRAAIEDLRRKAAKEKNDVTTMDLISAHVWCSVSNLAKCEEKAETILSIYIDGRKRFHNPPLSENFIGNAVVLASTPPIPSMKPTPASVIEAASILHKEVRGVNPSTWKYSLLGTFKLLEVYPNVPFWLVTTSSWLRFPLYEVNFGCGYGNPVFVCWNIASKFLPLGFAILFPPPPSQSKDTIASLQLFFTEEDSIAETLYSDDKFLSIFHSINTPS